MSFTLTTATVSPVVRLNIMSRAAGTASTEPLADTEPLVPEPDEWLTEPLRFARLPL